MDTVRKLLELSVSYDHWKTDYAGRASTFSFDKESRVNLPGTLFGQPEPLRMTDWAWRQVFTKLGPAVFGRGSYKSLPYDYLMAIPADLRAENLNRHLQAHNGTEWMVRAFQDQCRAVLSTDYLRVASTDVLRMMQKVWDEHAPANAQIIRSYVTPDELGFKTTWKDEVSGHYAVGIYVGNGEIGQAKLRVLPLIQRHSCTNSIIFDDENGISVTHRGDWDYLQYRIANALKNVFELSYDWLQKILDAEQQPIEDFASILDDLSKQHGWTDEQKTIVAIGTEGHETLAGLVNGISYAAHEAVSDPSETVTWELLAGRVLASNIYQVEYA